LPPVANTEPWNTAPYKRQWKTVLTKSITNGSWEVETHGSRVNSRGTPFLAEHDPSPTGFKLSIRNIRFKDDTVFPYPVQLPLTEDSNGFDEVLSHLDWSQITPATQRIIIEKQSVVIREMMQTIKKLMADQEELRHDVWQMNK
jgi:hypothetical protein